MNLKNKNKNISLKLDLLECYLFLKNNELENLQALCHNCHAVKTRKFKNHKNMFTTSQLHTGAGLMEVDEPLKKKRKME